MVLRLLTKEEREIAKRNGIPRSTWYNRIYNRGWDIERAITEKPSKDYLIDGYRESCKQNGISHALFLNRLKAGLSPEIASTRPLQKGVKHEL
jgi:hypothetical protein